MPCQRRARPAYRPLVCNNCRRAARSPKGYLRVPPRPLPRILRSAALAHPCASPAGYFLVVTRKYPKKRSPDRSPRKHRAVPCAPRPTGALRNSHCRLCGNAQTVLAHFPRWGCGARRARTGERQNQPATSGAIRVAHCALRGQIAGLAPLAEVELPQVLCFSRVDSAGVPDKIDDWVA
jgi:hypothetical protein